MKKAIFKNFTVIIVLALIICSSVSTYIFSRLIFNHTVDNMIYSLQLADYTLDYDQPLKDQIDQINSHTLNQDSRISVIDLDGTVEADSSVETPLENHLQRKEVQDALKSGIGKEVRYSSTLHRNLLYVAYLSNHGEIIRLAIPYSGMQDYLKMAVPGLVVSCAITFLVSLFLSRVLSRKITKPLEEVSEQLLSIQESQPVFAPHRYAYEELNDITMVTDRLANKINQSIISLRNEKNKLHCVLDNMQEGMIVLDERNHVTLINQSAAMIFNLDEPKKGQPIEEYVEDRKILKRIKSENNYETFHIGDQYYSIHKALIDRGVFKNHQIVVILDVTQEEVAMKMKQAFFSNASHELKTPLTSIQGYAELLDSNLIQDPKQKEVFVDRILNETRNMTRLINDILEISKLENHQTSVTMTNLKLDLVIEDLFHTLTPLANDRDIKLIYTEHDQEFYADLDQMNQLLINLLSNSVKYGKDGGFVKIDFKTQTDGIQIIVEDDGIGIPEEDLPHVTERFYRVDKGRTKTIEGTGLGLAIVKHIVQMYEGDLTIESKLGVGTKTTIFLKDMSAN